MLTFAPLDAPVHLGCSTHRQNVPTQMPRMALVIPPDVKEKITALAKEHRRSTSAEIVVAIESWLEQHSSEK